MSRPPVSSESTVHRFYGRPRAAGCVDGRRRGLVVMNLAMDPRPLADAAGLIARIADRDREAFGRFYDAFAGMALAVIRRIVRDAAAAEDVLQDVFWQIW